MVAEDAQEVEDAGAVKDVSRKRSKRPIKLAHKQVVLHMLVLNNGACHTRRLSPALEAHIQGSTAQQCSAHTPTRGGMTRFAAIPSATCHLHRRFGMAAQDPAARIRMYNWRAGVRRGLRPPATKTRKRFRGRAADLSSGQSHPPWVRVGIIHAANGAAPPHVLPHSDLHTHHLSIAPCAPFGPGARPNATKR